MSNHPNWIPTRLRRSGVLLGLTASLLMAGCYGRFPLTRSIYKFNGNLSADRYIRSIAFWPLSIVYAGAAIVDALIINVLEFWSGDRIVDTATLPDGSHIKMASAGSGQPLVVTIEREGTLLVQRQFVAAGNGKFEVQDAAQNKLGTLQKLQNGKFEVRNLVTSPLQAANIL